VIDVKKDIYVSYLAFSRLLYCCCWLVSFVIEGNENEGICLRGQWM